MWQPMSTAPQEYTVLLDVGLPWAVAGAWCPTQDQWVYANIQCSMCDGEQDVYFESEHEKTPLGWMPMPEPDIRPRAKR